MRATCAAQPERPQDGALAAARALLSQLVAPIAIHRTAGRYSVPVPPAGAGRRRDRRVAGPAARAGARSCSSGIWCAATSRSSTTCDIDRVSAEELIAAGAVAVLNCSPSSGGSLPEPRPAAAGGGRHRAGRPPRRLAVRALADGDPVVIRPLSAGADVEEGAPARPVHDAPHRPRASRSCAKASTGVW